MSNSIISEVLDLRWYLPVRTPGDRATEKSVEGMAENAGWQLLRQSSIDTPRITHAFLTDDGEQTDPDAAPDSSTEPEPARTAESRDPAAILSSTRFA